MLHLLAALLAAAPLTQCFSHAAIPPLPIPPRISAGDGARLHSQSGEELPPVDTVYTFDQLIDHNNPGLGTFQQRYWSNWEFYQPGGVIVFNTPGESNAEGYMPFLTNDSINGQIAQAHNGATVMLEHRFYGFSNPLPDLSVESLRFHTIQQAIDDLEYFAKNAKLPFPGGDQVGPDKVPWVLVGGSYAGALTAFTNVNKPGLFAAYYASSAVVESITNLWAWFEPVRLHMPQNCSLDVQAAIARFDSILTGKNQTAISALKASFGLEDLAHPEDFAVALKNNLWAWQFLGPSSGDDASVFYDFCDALEVVDGANAGPNGRGGEYALAAWGKYWTDGYYTSLCGDMDAETCLGSYNASDTYFTSTAIDNYDRSWMWIVCNEMGFFQNSAPFPHPTLVSHVWQDSDDERTCQLFFPTAFPRPTPPPVERTNFAYEGWNVHTTNIYFGNGQRDPWMYATVSSPFTYVPDTPEQSIGLSEGGFHCSDMITLEGQCDASVLAVQKKGLAAIARYLAEWKAAKTGAY
ncbi:peptidase S28 [Auriscalpium vulgare]|uniref:Peptidase S28 n=1 Tax=Auriscalpium vulgare TaxID=40419 RepID=A0ACB8RWA2_9AGAM|nr:peptidase S28 [Auriscalpium vulgare]